MTAIGVVETNSIPLGIQAGDAMLKAASVTLCAAQTACAGKYLVVISGEVAAIRAAVDAGTSACEGSLIDSLIIPNVDKRVALALMGAPEIHEVQALCVIETFSLASTISAADTAVKTAQVELLEVRLGRGMGGKSFLSFTGEVASAQAAAKAIASSEGARGLIGSCVVIPSPHTDMVKALL